MIKSKLLSMCICPALLAPPAVLAVHKPARHAVARALHRVADNMDKPRARVAPVQYASLPCEPVLAGGGTGSLLDAGLPGGIGGPGIGGGPLGFGAPETGRTIAYAPSPVIGGGGGFVSSTSSGGGGPIPGGGGSLPGDGGPVPGGGGTSGGGGTPGGGGSTLPPVAGVPEPESWAFMIAGMGIVGGILRYRRVAPA